MSDNQNRDDPLAPYQHLLRGAFDVSPPTGWEPLVARLLARIEAALAPEERAEFRISQVKEKFAQLRVYHNGGEAIEALVDEADAEARRTCQVCGQPGRRQPGGWLAILCDEHNKRQF
ncbi:hypothetical protein [Aureimonas sp. SK2]|uniref:hypothetical protein n=1 Tax=Aureimonas sp. SK2 TaxID=3015992 RepID=UPI002443A84E|nr:hypothetical protein [Aureimonas sp. SK2]